MLVPKQYLLIEFRKAETYFKNNLDKIYHTRTQNPICRKLINYYKAAQITGEYEIINAFIKEVKNYIRRHDTNYINSY